MGKAYLSFRASAVAALLVAISLPTSLMAVPFTINNAEPFGFDCASIPAGQDANLSCLGATPDHIEWVDGSSPVSALDLFALGPLAGVNPGDGPLRITRIAHDNNVISESFNYNIDLIGNIQITDEASSTIVLDAAGRIAIEFTETVNAGPCPAPNPAGSICDDFFDFDATSLAPLPFNVDGINYVLIFGLEPGDGTTVIGNRVFTAENATSDLFLTVQIRQVPEPVTLALLAFGLLGMGATTRVRKLH